jgi:CHAD domain-containing protein
LIRSSFIPPENYTKEQFLSDLGNICSFKEGDPISVKLQIFDTFDWRLFNKSLSLYRFGDMSYLYHLGEGLIIWSGRISEIPAFAQDFPDESLRVQLEPVTGIRALFTALSGRIDSYSFRVLNKDDKTTTRVRYESFHGDGMESVQPFVYIRVIPVRGYQSSFTRMEKFFKEQGFLDGARSNLYSAFMAAVGKIPGDYSSRLDIQLSGEMRSDEALRIILRYLLKVMRQNEPGIKSDIDTEFLHDYRVSIRRTRSALSQLKGVFPPESTAGFREDFARFGELTNSLRDLDVYLLKEDQYREILPQELKNDLNPLFIYLKGKHQKELASVTRFLETEEYRARIMDYEHFLNETIGESQDAPYAAKSVYDLAQENIYERYKRVLKKGHAARRSADEDELHRLRIECKKLRYLIEFFSSLFDPDGIALILKQLRRLQDNLGDFNDVVIQMGYLMDISQELAGVDETQTRTLLAIGSLIGSLEKKKQEYKGQFNKIYNKFASPKNKGLYSELFSKDSGTIS